MIESFFHQILRSFNILKQFPRQNFGNPEFAEILAEFFFLICKTFRCGIYNHKPTDAFGKEFYSLYDATRQLRKF